MDLKNLNKAIKKYETKKKARRKREEREDRIELEKEEKYRKNEKKLAGKKEQIYKKILEWRDNLVKTKQFKKLFTKNEGEIIIYWGNWGHERPAYGQYGCWSRVYLEKSGKLRYWAGYKWMGGSATIYLDQNTFKKLSYKYINELYKEIHNGGIYKTIARELKEREE